MMSDRSTAITWLDSKGGAKARSTGTAVYQPPSSRSSFRSPIRALSGGNRAGMAADAFTASDTRSAEGRPGPPSTKSSSRVRRSKVRIPSRRTPWCRRSKEAFSSRSRYPGMAPACREAVRERTGIFQRDSANAKSDAGPSRRDAWIISSASIPAAACMAATIAPTLQPTMASIGIRAARRARSTAACATPRAPPAPRTRVIPAGGWAAGPTGGASGTRTLLGWRSAPRQTQAEGARPPGGAADDFEHGALRPEDEDQCGSPAWCVPRRRPQDGPAAFLDRPRAAAGGGGGQAVLPEKVAADEPRQPRQRRIGRQAEHERFAPSGRHDGTARPVIVIRDLREAWEAPVHDPGSRPVVFHRVDPRQFRDHGEACQRGGMGARGAFLALAAAGT